MRRVLSCLLGMLLAVTAQAAPKQSSSSFAVIGERASADDASLLESFRLAGKAHVSFIVMNGIRSQQEACSDAMYQRRVRLLAGADRPVFASLAGRDWAGCVNEQGHSIAQERLNFVRGAWFEGDSMQATKNLSLVHQSTAAKFRNYSENMRWDSKGILFATINLPSNNNNFLAAAGRDNEFEDRQIASRHWLQRIFAHARSHRLKGIVLFTDGNLMNASARSGRAERRDGFADVRKQLQSLAAKYPGRVLLVHGQPSSGNIAWRDNVGTVGVGRGVYEIGVKPGAAAMFSVKMLSRNRR